MSDILKGKEFEIVNTDCIEHMATMPDHSIDIVTAAQAFHWFDIEKFREECRRILIRTSDSGL